MLQKFIRYGEEGAREIDYYVFLLVSDDRLSGIFRQPRSWSPSSTIIARVRPPPLVPAWRQTTLYYEQPRV